MTKDLREAQLAMQHLHSMAEEGIRWRALENEIYLAMMKVIEAVIMREAVSENMVLLMQLIREENRRKGRSLLR